MILFLATLACGDAPEDCAQTWYLDFDGDGFGGADFPLDACDAPEGYVDNADDCDDADSLTFPGGEELCNGLDDDCDGSVDNGASDAQVFYADLDGDGFGDAEATLEACELPEGYSDISTDCDDGDGGLSPGSPEVCDGIDNDCDGVVDFDGWIPADYGSFADAASSASDGDHICVSPGRYEDGGIELDRSITFEGAGDVELDAQNSWLFRTDSSDLDVGLIGMTLSSLATNTSAGAVLYGGYDTDVLLQDVRIDGLSCEANTCAGLVVYTEAGSRVQMVDVELTNAKTTSTYQYSSVGAVLAYVEYGELVLDGVEVHDNTFNGNYWGTFYAEGSRVSVSDLHVYDNTFAAHYSFYGGLGYSYSYGNDEAYDGVSFSNNDITFDHSYGYVYGAGLYLENYGDDPVPVQHLEFSHNTFSGSPLQVYGGALYFSDGNYAVENARMANNTFENGTYLTGPFLYTYGAEVGLTNVDMSYNAFDFSSTEGGFATAGWRGDLTVTNTNVSTNSFGDQVRGAVLWSEYGVDDDDGATFSWDYSNVFQSGSGELFSDSSDAPLGLSTLEVDPGHADQDTLELAAGSALIDAGAPDLLDEDGSVSDIGAYGGPGGGAW